MAVNNFRDLIAWKKAYDVSLMTYSITESFPKSELFGLTSQMRRAAVSVCSNIAEGFGRTSAKEKDNFYSIAKGSLTELECQYELSNGIGLLASDDLSIALQNIIEAQKVLAGLQRKNKEKGTGL